MCEKIILQNFPLIISTADRDEENKQRGIGRHTSMFSICLLTPGRSNGLSNNFILIPSKCLLNLTEFLVEKKKNSYLGINSNTDTQFEVEIQVKHTFIFIMQKNKCMLNSLNSIIAF